MHKENKNPPAGCRPRRGRVSMAYRENVSIISRGSAIYKGAIL